MNNKKLETYEFTNKEKFDFIMEECIYMKKKNRR